MSWFACCPKTRRAAWDSGPRASPRCLQRGTKWGTNAEACLSLGQLRGNYLPALRPFLTNQSHANLLGLRPAASVDDAHEDACITKDPHICHTRSRPSKPAGPGASGMMSPLLSKLPSKLLPMKSSEMIRRNEATSPLASAASQSRSTCVT